MLTEPSLKNLTKPDFGKPPDKQNEFLQELGKPHIQSFNYFLRTGLDLAVADLNPVEFEISNESRIRITIESAHISPPAVPAGVIGIRTQSIFPTECRQKHDTYRGKLTITIGWSIDGVKQPSVEKDMGNIPIMLKSDACHLSKMTPAQLVEHNEHPEEWGGYFVVKGLEKLVRMLLLSRRNYPFTIARPTWKQRGVNFSDLGVQIRCVKRDQTTVSNVIHYLTNGTAKLMFSYQKNLFYLPIMLLLKSLQNCSDKRIYEALVGLNGQSTHFGVCVENMLRALHTEGLHTQEDCKSYLGKMFKVKFWEVPQWASDISVTDFILKRCILIHLDSDEDKFNLLVLMLQKLFSVVNNDSITEGSDSIMMQEILLGGHLYLQIVKEKLGAWMYNLRAMIFKRMKNNLDYNLSQTEFVSAARYAGGLQNILESFLSTGNLSSHSGLGLMQDKGLTIVAENINRMRYMSHFKSIHRGSFFVEMRTTEVRQLLPDAWGFICPVHTPDGAPCGLLNHLTMNCQITDAADEDKVANIAPILTSLGMIPLGFISTHNPKNSYVAVLNGKVIGYIPDEIIGRVVDKLRAQKIEGEKIPKTTELGLIPKRNVPGQYPGLFIFTGPARMMRPVINLALKKIELIGTLEQVYLDICIIPEESHKGFTTHMEISECSFMSNLAQLIPMPDCNQSPRNMYQCQMGKQTMGTPCHNWGTVGDTKLYRLETPASPFFRPLHYDNIELDNFAMGVNAYVAVISYTGYDMEDAMIINKASYERGLAHGCIYKTEFIDLPDVKSYFCRDPENEKLSESLDNDGLPHPSNKINSNDPFYCYFDANANKYVVKRYHETEEVVVDSVRICGNLSQYAPKRAAITYRIIRNPSVGDKFASRAGQKGICSKLWPSEDLPFSETGLIPDIVFNPHGFPSRMTIAMMIEVLAGKSAVLHGLVHDATPFRFNEDNTAIDYFGKFLEAAGYNYYGTEPMYSGVDGRELKAHIFTGIVHYQRLRHMVSDKWQVRRTGPVDAITRQPVKGRKQGGGVRFGEMERDALISHGATFLLQDRLFNCSDKSIQQICRTCGSLLGAISITTRRADKPFLSEVRNTCKLCKEKSEIVDVEMPYVFKYFATELASVNIHVKLQLKHV